MNRETRLPWRLAVVLAISVVAAAGCGHRTYTTQPPAPTPQPSPSSRQPPPTERQPVVPGEYVEEGVASWYGIPFDGHRTSNGEIYDMHAFTAAHRTLPFGAVVRVTNLRNGQQTEVRINDRGPFVANRIIDLSFSAAQAIGMVGTGTAPVRLELTSGLNPQVGFFGVQVGAFASQDNAARLRAQLAMRYSPVSIAVYDSPSGIFYRVRVGRLPTEDAARQLAGELRSDEQLNTFVVRLDD
ncbi:MAG: septal ring lytic transglycosylase RlpA family protein [Candidatus Acidiferrales bacterium]